MDQVTCRVKLIDSSFLRVYTHPSKPAGIGDLACLQMEPGRPVRGGTEELCGGSRYDGYAASPITVPYSHTKGSAGPLRDLMGFFPFAGVISSLLNPLRMGAARCGWPEVLWRRHSSSKHQRQSLVNTCRFPAPRPLFQSRATSLRSPERASQSIQRASLARSRFSTASALRRWMLPTLERGPPVHIGV